MSKYYILTQENIDKMVELIEKVKEGFKNMIVQHRFEEKEVL